MELIRFHFQKIATYIIENMLKIFWILPLERNQIMFISYKGDYSDSPKYIYRELKTKSSNVRFVWAVNKKSRNELEISDCKRVEFGTLGYIKMICTSRIVVTNNFLNTYIPRRENQFIVNTWHGGSPLKTVGMVNEPVSSFERFFYRHHEKKYNIYLSSSRFMTEEVFRKSFGYKGKVFGCGLPRNAILYREAARAKQKVADVFGIPVDDEHGIILYAPTFRGGAGNAGFIPARQQFDICRCITVIEDKFNKKYKFFFRSHYFNENIPEDCMNASDYPDMQELLLASDVLITDYSSCMGDMCLMYKPVFLYAPDLMEYISDRGFYWDIFSLPFPVSKNEEELYENIKNFDEKNYSKGVNGYLERLSSYEGPDSDIKAANYLLELMLKDELNE